MLSAKRTVTQIDGHHAATYVVARLAGFDHSHWKQFHDALQAHCIDVVPRFCLVMAFVLHSSTVGVFALRLMRVSPLTGNFYNGNRILKEDEITNI